MGSRSKGAGAASGRQASKLHDVWASEEVGASANCALVTEAPKAATMTKIRTSSGSSIIMGIEAMRRRRDAAAGVRAYAASGP